ncbi:MAG: outer membrane lipoprotein-sorting protein [Pseudomonadota bacterium]
MRVSLTVVTALLLSGVALAQDNAARGLEIATEADRRNDGFADSTATLTMTLRNKQGQEVTRAMRNRTLEVDGDGDKSLIIFDDPRDVKGTAFLTFSHKTGDDDQWLYLPALKRVKRISSSNKSGPFMGSEFAYEDLSSQEVEKYTYNYLRDETLDGVETYVIERFAVAKKSGYTREVVWIDKDEYRARQVEYYDRKESRLKTLKLSNYEQYLDKYWRALRMDMENHQTGKSTTLEFDDYVFGNGLTDKDFNRNSLAKAR